MNSTVGCAVAFIIIDSYLYVFVDIYEEHEHSVNVSQ